MDKAETLRKAANLTRQLLPLAERLIADDFSAEDRHEYRRRASLRSNAGTHTVFRLSEALNALCSETARNTSVGGEAASATKARLERIRSDIASRYDRSD